MKTVLVLGAAACQVPIITRCRAMGLRVLVASIAGPYPGFELADAAYTVDVRDQDGLLKIAQANHIDGILTDQTDLPVSSAAWVAERMGLPGIGYECALRFTNKKLMRLACEEIGIPVPRSLGSASIGDVAAWAEKTGYPVMIKPADSQGSRGVQCVREPAHLATAFGNALRYSATGEVVVEEFFRGREIVIEGVAAGGKYHNLVIGDRRYFRIPDRFIPQSTLFPSNLPAALQERLLDLNRRLIAGLGLPFGITHSEYLIQPDTGEIRLVETAARGGGVFISSDLIPLACGIDANEALIQCALGDVPTQDFSAPQSTASGYVCFTLPEGVVSEPPNTAEIEAIPGVHRACLADLVVGRTIGGMNDKTMRLGPILLHAADRSRLDALHAQVRESLRVTVSTPAGPLGAIWD